MHELAIVQSMLDIVLEHARQGKAQRVQSIGLKIGELRDLVDEYMQSYFDYLSKDTIAAGAILKIERLPVIFLCEACGNKFPVRLQEVERITCPHCGDEKVNLFSGREFYIDHLEVI
jgi:hydrogenase nickel incorporation protein HypA/HybF